MQCPNCGAELASTSRFCMYCGMAAPTETLPTSAAATPVPPTTPASATAPAPAPSPATAPAPASATAPAPATPPKKKKPIAAIIAGIVVVLAIIAAVVTTYALGIWGGTRMPDLEGMTLAKAQETLSNAGITDPEIVYEITEDARDIVVGQEPSAGERVDGAVTLHVTAPPTIPANILEMSAEDAQAALKDLKLNVTVVDYADKEPNRVVFCTPAPGEEVKAGDIAYLTVTRDPKVPTVIGSSLTEAEDALWLEGLESSITYVDSTERQDTVIDVSPAEGTSLGWGDTVELTLAQNTSNQGLDYPSLLNMNGSELDQELAAHGYMVLFHTATSDSDDNVVYTHNDTSLDEYVALGSGYPWVGMILYEDGTYNTDAPGPLDSYDSLFATWYDSTIPATLEGVLEVMETCGVSDLREWFASEGTEQMAAVGKVGDRVWTIGIDADYDFICFGIGPESAFTAAYGDDMWVFDEKDTCNSLSLLALGYEV